MAATSTEAARARRASRTDGIRLQPPAMTSRSMGTPAVPRCERRVAACAVLWSSAARQTRPRGRATHRAGCTVTSESDIEKPVTPMSRPAVAPVGERLAVDPAAPVLVVGAEQAQHAASGPARCASRPATPVVPCTTWGYTDTPWAGQRAHDVGVGHVLAGHQERLRRAEAVHRGCRCRRPRGGGRHGVVVPGDGQHGPARRLRRGGRSGPCRPVRRPTSSGTKASPTPRWARVGR